MCFQLLFSFFYCNNDKKDDDDDDYIINESYIDKYDDSKCDKSSLNYYVRNNTFGIDLLR
jgi:hypothetical protein